MSGVIGCPLSAGLLPVVCVRSAVSLILAGRRRVDAGTTSLREVVRAAPLPLPVAAVATSCLTLLGYVVRVHAGVEARGDQVGPAGAGTV